MCIYVYVFLSGVIVTSLINITLYFSNACLGSPLVKRSDGCSVPAIYLVQLDFQCCSYSELPDVIDPGVNMSRSIVHARVLD